jgi:hypothetical protein
MMYRRYDSYDFNKRSTFVRSDSLNIAAANTATYLVDRIMKTALRTATETFFESTKR